MLWTALDGQTAQLDQASGRVADLVAITDACEKHQAAVSASLEPHSWRYELAHLLSPPKAPSIPPPRVKEPAESKSSR
jgi:hypothetical protein